MSDVAHSLVRRAVDITQQHYANENGGDEHQIKQITVWGMVLLWATAIAYMALISAVRPYMAFGIYIDAKTMANSSCVDSSPTLMARSLEL